jgi:hypothetical protein
MFSKLTVPSYALSGEKINGMAFQDVKNASFQIIEKTFDAINVINLIYRHLCILVLKAETFVDT